MDHLTGLDSVFLHTETPETPMHVASIDMLELPAGYEGDFYEDARSHIEQRMHLAPVFTRKLALMPFELSNPVWVEDDDIDLDYHVRHLVLPRPGSFEQLERTVARIHSSLLDRSRPLWEFYIIEGLESGHVALYAKVHHAGIDGQGGMALLSAIMDTSPEPRKIAPPTRNRQRGTGYQLGMAELLNAAISNSYQQYTKLFKTLPAMWEAFQSMARQEAERLSEGGSGLADLANRRQQFGGPSTLFNVSITNQRSYAARSIPLAQVKAMSKTAGVSLNDVVLAVSAGAMMRYLEYYDQKPTQSLVAAIPVTLREKGNTDNNNQVTTTLMTLATDIPDRLQRLRAITESANSAKAVTGTFKAAIPTDFPSFGAPWLMTGLTNLMGRSQLIDRIPPIANVLISNVPGPQFPLYFAGARMRHFYPVSIPAHGMALNITLQSYDGWLDFGLIACRRAVPDIDELAGFFLEEFETLRQAIQAHGRPLSELPPLEQPAAGPLSGLPGLRDLPKGPVGNLIGEALGMFRESVEAIAGAALPGRKPTSQAVAADREATGAPSRGTVSTPARAEEPPKAVAPAEAEAPTSTPRKRAARKAATREAATRPAAKNGSAGGRATKTAAKPAAPAKRAVPTERKASPARKMPPRARTPQAGARRGRKTAGRAAE